MAEKTGKGEVNLLLMGKTGHGKSSTGNSILGRRHFVARGGGGSITKSFSFGYTEEFGKIIKVVDIPGVLDTDEKSNNEKEDLVSKAVAESMKQFPDGFDALLLILSYTVRITDDEKKAIESLKGIFGENVLKDHTICVFTHGDSFRNDNGDDADFKQWCKNETYYKDLFEECKWRCVLFDNMTRDVNEKKSQLTSLLSEIDKMKNRHNNFTIDVFMAADKRRDEMKREALLLEKYSRELGLIEDGLHKLMYSSSGDRLGGIDKLKKKALNLLNDLKEHKYEKLLTIKGKLNDLSIRLENFKTIIADQEQTKAEKEKLQNQMETLEQNQIEELAKLRERENEMEKDHNEKLAHMKSTISGMQGEIEKEKGGFFKELLNAVTKRLQGKLNPGPQLNLLLMGKSGHGKSSTGNSILGWKAFKALGGGGSVTKQSQVESTRIDRRDIKVIDIPGMCDNHCQTQEAKVDLVIEAISTGISLSTEGISAFLFVLSFGVRMTEEEKQVIKTLKTILGDDVFQKHTICVFTHGDSFKRDNIGEDFRRWCRKQEEYDDLLRDCEGRFVLFDNLTRDPSEKKSQLIDLVSEIDNLRHKSFYNSGLQWKTREEIRTELRLPLIIEKCEKEITSISSCKIGMSEERLDDLKQRILNLKTGLPDYDHPILSDLIVKIEMIEQDVLAHEMVMKQERELLEKERLEKERLEELMERRQREMEELRREEEERLEQQARMHGEELQNARRMAHHEEQPSCFII